MDDSESLSLRKAFANSPGHEAIRASLFERAAFTLGFLLNRNFTSEQVLGAVYDLRAIYDLLISVDLSVQDVQVFAAETIRTMQATEAAEMARVDQTFESARRSRGSEPLR